MAATQHSVHRFPRNLQLKLINTQLLQGTAYQATPPGRSLLASMMPFSSRNEQLLSQLTKSTLDLGHASGEHCAGRLGSRKPSTDQASSSRLPQIIYPTKAGSKTSQVELGYCSWRIVDAMGTEAILLGRREEDVFSCQTTDKCPKPRDPKPQSG